MVRNEDLTAADGKFPNQHWRDWLLFNEYYHGETDLGFRANQPTGWSRLLSNLIDEWRR